MIRRIAALPAVALAAALLVPGAAFAHAELASTTPADGAELSAPPDEVVMVFDGELDPQHSSFVVTDASGAEVGSGAVDLQVAERNEMRGDVEISEPGEYTVTWTASAADGHPEEGTFTFSVIEPDTSGGTTATPPNTATMRPTPVATVAGMVLLTAATLLGLRRLARVRA